MSLLVDGSLGTFNLVERGERPAVLFLCPHCREWLPLADGHLYESEPVDHESKVNAGSFCTFRGTRRFAADLLDTMLGRIVAGYAPTRPESLPPMYRREKR